MSNTCKHILLEVCPQCLRQSNGRGALALSERSRGHPSDDNVPAVRLVPQTIQNRQRDFSLVGAIGFQLLERESGLVYSSLKRVVYSSLVPRPSITANVVKLLRRMTSGGLLNT